MATKQRMMKVAPTVTDPSMRLKKMQAAQQESPEEILKEMGEDIDDVDTLKETVFSKKKTTKEEKEADAQPDNQGMNTMLIVIFGLVVIILVALIIWLVMRQNEQDKKQEENMRNVVKPNALQRNLTQSQQQAYMAQQQAMQLAAQQQAMQQAAQQQAMQQNAQQAQQEYMARQKAMQAAAMKEKQKTNKKQDSNDVQQEILESTNVTVDKNNVDNNEDADEDGLVMNNDENNPDGDDEDVSGNNTVEKENDPSAPAKSPKKASLDDKIKNMLDKDESLTNDDKELLKRVSKQTYEP